MHQPHLNHSAERFSIGYLVASLALLAVHAWIFPNGFWPLTIVSGILAVGVTNIAHNHAHCAMWQGVRPIVSPISCSRRLWGYRLSCFQPRTWRCITADLRRAMIELTRVDSATTIILSVCSYTHCACCRWSFPISFDTSAAAYGFHGARHRIYRYSCSHRSQWHWAREL